MNPPSEGVTAAELLKWAAETEQLLRDQVAGGTLAPRAEAMLEALRNGGGTLTGALRLWAYVKHLYYSHKEGLTQGRDGSEEAAADVARKLLRREPVRVQLGHRTVDVTGRSYAALAEIAQHANRLLEIDTDVQRVESLERATLQDLAGGAGARRRRSGTLRRRFRLLATIHRRLLVEALCHRRAIYAHALTPDGRPAASLADAPEWWVELGPVDDALLIAAVWEAGVGRYTQLGTAPDVAGGHAAAERAEDWGWGSCFSAWERSMKLQPAALYDSDLGQFSAWIRGGATAPPETND